MKVPSTSPSPKLSKVNALSASTTQADPVSNQLISSQDQIEVKLDKNIEQKLSEEEGAVPKDQRME